MKKRFKPLMLSMAMAVGVGASLNAGSAAAATNPTDKLPTADWKYDVPAGHDLGWVFDSGNVTKDRLYVTLFSEKEGGLQTQSFDRKNGASNWVYDFQGGAENVNIFSSQVVSRTNGDVYFVGKKDNEKSQKLYAVSSSGKLKWSKAIETGLTGSLEVLSNGDLLLSSISSDQKTTHVYQFANDGKLKKKDTVDGSQNLSVLSNGEVVNTTNKKIEWYKNVNTLKSPTLSYKLPENTTVASNFRSWGGSSKVAPAVYPFNGGNLVGLVKEELPERKTPGVEILDPSIDNREFTYVLFDAKGKKVWERKIPKGAFVITAGENLLVKDGLKLELYGPDNKLKASKTFEEKDFLVYKAPNEEIAAFDKVSGEFYALSPKDLSVNHHVSLDPSTNGKAKYGFLYGGEGKLYVHDTQGENQNTVSAYTLK
ncbi:hypothetical protein [Saccharibacillus sacchari]|uniref:Uncharacterized protein n=1 Tax=Saccharibacillus sacchari TaxID=456493 RepID=A0ACC6PG38_9BACL